MTVEHPRPLLDLVRDQQLLCKVAERLARADVPPSIIEAIRMGRMTTFVQDEWRGSGDRGGRRGKAIGCTSCGPRSSELFRERRLQCPPTQTGRLASTERA